MYIVLGVGFYHDILRPEKNFHFRRLVSDTVLLMSMEINKTRVHHIPKKIIDLKNVFCFFLNNFFLILILTTKCI